MNTTKASLGIPFYRFCLLLGFLLIVSACSSKLSPDELTDRARQSYQDGNYNTAVVDLKASLQINAENSVARHLLGQTYMQIGDYRAAEKELMRANSGAEPYPQAKIDLALTLLSLHKVSELNNITAEGLSARQQATLLSVKAMAALRSNAANSAKIFLEEAERLAPGEPSVRVALSRYTFNQSKPMYDDARRQVKTLLQDHPKNIDAFLLLGDIENKSRNLDASIEAYSEVLDIAPSHQTALSNRAQVAIQLSNFEAARADIAKLGPWSRNSPRIAFLKGMMALNEKDFESAQAYLELAERNEQSFPTSLLFLAQIHYLSGHMESAERYTTRYLSHDPENFHAAKLLANIKFSLGYYSEAEKLLRPVVAFQDKDVSALELLVKSLINQGKIEEAVDLLAVLVQLKPESAIALLQLGAGQAAQNNLTSAIENLEFALDMDPDLEQAQIVYILLLLNSGNFERAEKSAQDYATNKSSVTAYNLLGRVYNTRGELQKAEEAFNQAWTIDPGNHYSAKILSEYALKVGDTKKARGYQVVILEKTPGHLGALMALAKIDAMEGNQELMVEHLQKAVETNPLAVDPRLILTRLMVAQGELEKASALLQPLINNEDSVPQVLQISGVIDIRNEKYDVAEKKLLRLTALRPSASYPHYLLAYAYSGQSKLQESVDELTKAVNLAPEAALPRATLARILLIQGEKDVAEEHLDHLMEIAPDNPATRELWGRLHAAQGKHDAAARDFADAFTLQPAGQHAIQLAKAKYKLDDESGAIEILRAWITDNPGDDDARLLLSQYLTSSGDQENARKQLEVLCSRQPARLVALNNLAWMLRESDPEKAIGYAKQANKQAPESAEVLDTLAMAYFFNKQYLLAERTITQVVKTSPRQTSYTVHYASILAAMGNSERAIELLGELLSSDEQFPEKEAAQQLLSTLRN